MPKSEFINKKIINIDILALVLAYAFAVVLLFSAVVLNVFSTDFYFTPLIFALVFMGWISFLYIYTQKKKFKIHYQIITLLLLIWFVIIMIQRIKILTP